MDLLGKEMLREMYMHWYAFHFERSLLLDKKDFIAIWLAAAAVVLLAPINSDLAIVDRSLKKRGKISGMYIDIC